LLYKSYKFISTLPKRSLDSVNRVCGINILKLNFILKINNNNVDNGDGAKSLWIIF
jgi:hypothetical protein